MSEPTWRQVYGQCATHPRHSLARREITSAMRKLGPDFLSEWQESEIELAAHQYRYPDAYCYAEGEWVEGYASVRGYTSSDVLTWSADDLAAHRATGREPAHTRMLERAADAFLRAHGEDVIRLDVIDRWTKQPTVAPDRVAYRGIVRARSKPPVRYHVARPACVWSDDPIIASATIGIPPRTILEYRTDRVGHAWSWVGFRKVATGPDQREARRAHRRRSARSARVPVATATRGRVRSGWSLSARSLPNAWKKADAGQMAAAVWIRDALVIHAANDSELPIRFGPDLVAVVVDDGRVARVTAHGPSAPMTFQAFGRRAALAREEIDA